MPNKELIERLRAKPYDMDKQAAADALEKADLKVGLTTSLMELINCEKTLLQSQNKTYYKIEKLISVLMIHFYARFCR